MDTFTATGISLAILFGNALLLFLFKIILLDRIKIRLIKYVLGMIFAYGLLMYLMRLSMEYDEISIAFQRARFFRFTDAGIIPYVIPAIYSVFLVGYFEEERDWSRVRAMMLSMFVNGILVLFGAMIYYSRLKGDSFEKIFARLKASAEYIDGKFTLLFIGILVLAYFLVKWHYFKHNKK